MGGSSRHEKDRDYSEGGSSRRSRQDETGNVSSSASNEVGREFANRYGGLFSEKDWKCPICSNINWARRAECNQCKTPKPGLETTMGSREGRGGGFMERDEVIEYRRSRDAEKDEEWDEFGRKRKKNKDCGVGNNGSGRKRDLSQDGENSINKQETNGKKDNQNKSNDDREQSKKPRLNEQYRRRSSRSRSPYHRDRSLSRYKRSRRSSRSISRDRMRSRSKSRDRKKSEIDSRYYRLRSRSRERDLDKERNRRKSHRLRQSPVIFDQSDAQHTKFGNSSLSKQICCTTQKSEKTYYFDLLPFPTMSQNPENTSDCNPNQVPEDVKPYRDYQSSLPHTDSQISQASTITEDDSRKRRDEEEEDSDENNRKYTKRESNNNLRGYHNDENHYDNNLENQRLLLNGEKQMFDYNNNGMFNHDNHESVEDVEMINNGSLRYESDSESGRIKRKKLDEILGREDGETYMDDETMTDNDQELEQENAFAPIPEGLCVECRDQDASFFCEQCSEDFCEVCFAMIHRTGNRQKHTKKNLKNEQSSNDALENGTQSVESVSQKTSNGYTSHE
ncbi:594_t:CDS:10, partial [Racocetra persica]